MNTHLTAQALTLSYTSATLFKELSLNINQGDKIGLIGHNGCGKSSLLKLLSGQYEPSEGYVAKAKQCQMSYVEQHLPQSLQSTTVLAALTETLAKDEYWRAELLLGQLRFSESECHMPIANCSGGQQMRLLLARAIINEPDLLLLDEPSNHLDLASLMWLEHFLSEWKGSFVLVSHDQTLLDSVTNATWIMRDQTLHHFALPCTRARSALEEQDQQDQLRHMSEQKEIDRIDKSAKRLANWGKVYDNEDLARKAKTMFARKDRLLQAQTELSEGIQWRLKLHGSTLPANRLLEILSFKVKPLQSELTLFNVIEKRIKSGDRIAVLGSNGCGKSTMLNLLYQIYLEQQNDEVVKGVDTFAVTFHEGCSIGYYDQSLEQLADQDRLDDALSHFSSVNTEYSKRALISAGFEYARHGQKVASLSGGERARLLFIGLSLAKYHMLFLDEPTNHLDMDGKEELIESLTLYEGAALLVSHDRSLIEQSCNRFWLIKNGVLTEYLTAQEAYQEIVEPGTTCVNAPPSILVSDPVKSIDSQLKLNEDEMLERLIEVESLLEEDLQRKPKHQKPALQQRWREEIDQIQALL